MPRGYRTCQINSPLPNKTNISLSLNWFHEKHKFCHSENLIKNEKPKGLQSYYCKNCEREQIVGDRRQCYNNEIKKQIVAPRKTSQKNSLLLQECQGFKSCDFTFDL